MSDAKPILGEDTIFGRLYYQDTDYAALEAENARLRAGQEAVCPGCNGTGDGVDMGDCAQVACMCNGTGVLATPQPTALRG